MCDATTLLPIPQWLRDLNYATFVSDNTEYGRDAAGRECLVIDACIAPGVAALWALGIPTFAACCLHGAGFGVITLGRASPEGGWLGFRSGDPYPPSASLGEREHLRAALGEREHLRAALAARDAEATQLRAAVLRVTRAWATLSACEDEFVPEQSEACGEYADQLDGAILDLLRVADPETFAARERVIRSPYWHRPRRDRAARR